MLSDLLESVLSTNIWAVLLAILALIVGSSALTMWIQKGFESKAESKRFKRDVRGSAVDAVGAAYVEYLKYQQETEEDADFNIATTQARLYGEVAKAGDASLLARARQFAQLGEKFASGDPFTSISTLEASFDALIDELVKSTPAK